MPGKLGRGPRSFCWEIRAWRRRRTARLVREQVKAGAKVLVTGRVKRGSCTESLLEEGAAFAMPYPHHQSHGDLRELMEENEFRTVMAFHSGRKEIFYSV